MISILAPSKTLDFDSPAPEWVSISRPLFQDKATQIAVHLQGMQIDEIAQLMNVSEPIAQMNYERMAAWGKQLRPALWAYRGDVYKGMYADQLSQDDARWANERLRVMSGLYGVLRPYDAMSPYRLEMKLKLPVDGAKHLYDFWGDTLARALDEVSGGIIVNLSSDEYSRPVIKYSTSRIVTPVFMDHKPNGKVGPVPIYSKMMRGVMARWIIAHRIDTPEALKDFDGFSYIYDASRSTPDAPVFVRETMTPLVF